MATSDYENRGPELQTVGYTLAIAAVVTYLLRCYTRVFLVKSFGFDDWSMLAALVGTSGDSPLTY
jgi:hypothetical protein